MSMSHIYMFIAGGFISAIIFYPRKSKQPVKVKVGVNNNAEDYLSSMLSFQFYSGIRMANKYTKEEIEPLVSDDNLFMSMCHHQKHHFTESAQTIIKKMQEGVQHGSF